MRRKLTWATAQKIRQLKKDEPLIGYNEIIRRLNLSCSDSAIWSILSNRTYLTRTERDKPYNPKAKLNESLAMEIRGNLKLGHKPEWLACKYGVSFSTIKRVIKQTTWRNTG